MSGTRKRAKAVRPRRAGRARRGARGGFAADELKADIQRKVATGEMPPGSRILSARDLAKAYSVSYATCHKALCELEAEGHLVRQQGRGSFVADPAAEGEISLRVSLLDTDRPRAVEAIDDFGSERPRLKLLTCRGRSPLGPADVRQMMSFEATAEADHLVPLDGFAAEIIASGELDPAATAMFTVGGALRAVPGYFAPLVFYANARVFERAGVDVPGEGWTFAEMIETSAQLEAALAPKASGVLFPRLYFLMPVFWSHGVDAGAGARWGLDSPGAHRALEIVREWRRSTSFPIGDNGVDKITRLVATGRLAVAPWNGAMAQPLLEKLGDDLVILPYPAGPRGSATILTGEGLGISTGCRQPEVAWELLKRLAEGR